jgi:hypothetical protein
MYKFTKVTILVIITGILALGVAAGGAALTGKAFAATCGNSDSCAKTHVPGEPGGDDAPAIAPGTIAQGQPANQFAPGQVKCPGGEAGC